MSILTKSLKEKLKKQLVHHEGLKTDLYLCPAEKWTIGVGRNLSDCGISQHEALYLLDNDIIWIANKLCQEVSWIPTLTEARQIVLLNMAFNLGVQGLLDFKQMFAALEVEDYDTAADEMLDSRWAVQVGKRALELSEIMRTNIL
ncbi:glycoside hydrolase family protein [Algicola sagamiensis]|uniref:glycoside hydrolase family protein n=1 Tax=Algicola sagamiensis TaxID=163869 RepID=UPI00035CEA91|nr:glycoside hydrolase family protein [Algicola sagamiensis]